MDRRTFLGTVAGCGATSLVGSAPTAPARGSAAPAYFGLHPFIEAHPEAVFIRNTDVTSKNDASGKKRAGAALVEQIFTLQDVPGIPLTHKFAIKPNLIGHYLAGHEPGNFGLFHIGRERGVSTALNPNNVPVYLWEKDGPKLTPLGSLARTPLSTPYLTRPDEAEYHLCDEPFAYAPESSSACRPGDGRPRIHVLGEKECHCPVEAAKLAKDSGKEKLYVVGEEKTHCEQAARLNLARAKYKVAIEAMVKAQADAAKPEADTET